MITAASAAPEPFECLVAKVLSIAEKSFCKPGVPVAAGSASSAEGLPPITPPPAPPTPPTPPLPAPTRNPPASDAATIPNDLGLGGRLESSAAAAHAWEDASAASAGLNAAIAWWRYSAALSASRAANVRRK